MAVESPTYFGVLSILQHLKLKVIEVPVDSNRGLDIDFLSRAIERKSVRACLLSSSFNNPIGCLTPDNIKRDVLDILKKAGIPLIEDDLYGDIYFAGDRPRPYGAFTNAGDVIYCSSYSKTIAPGYRLGWVCGPQHTTEILEKRFATTLCPPTLTQAAMASFLQTGAYDNHLRKLRRVFAANLSRARQVIAESFPHDTRVSRPAGGFSLWVELQRGFDVRELSERALQRGICFAPGQIFSAGDRYSHCLRLSCGYEWSPRLEWALRKLAELVNDMRC